MTDLPVTSVAASLDPEDGFRTVLVLNERNPVTGGPLTPPIDAASAVIVTTSGRIRRSLNFEGGEPNWDNAAPAEDTGEVYKVYRDAHDPNIWSRAWLAAEKGVWVCEYVFATPIVWTQVLTQAQFLAATGEALHAVRDIETARDRSGYTYCQAQGVSGMIYVGRRASSWVFTALEVTTKTLPVGFKVRPDYHKCILCAAGNSGAVYRSEDGTDAFEFKLWYTLPNAAGPVRSIEIPLDDWGVVGDVYVSGGAGNAGQMFISSWNPANISWSQNEGVGWTQRCCMPALPQFVPANEPDGIIKIMEATDGSFTAIEGWSGPVTRFWRSVDRCQDWTYEGAISGASERHLPSLVLPNGRMIIGWWGCIYASDNNGKWWSKIYENEDIFAFHSFCLNRYGDIIAGTDSAGGHDCDGFWRSQDNGETWEFMTNINTDPDWAEYPAAIVRMNSGILVAVTDIGTIYYSGTHGASWNFVDWMFKDGEGEGQNITCYDMLHLPNEYVLVGHDSAQVDGAGEWWAVSRCTNMVQGCYYPELMDWHGSLEHGWWYEECEGGGSKYVGEISTLGLARDKTHIVAGARSSIWDCEVKDCSAMFWNSSSGAPGYWHGINDLDEQETCYWSDGQEYCLEWWSSEMYSLMTCQVEGPKIIKNPNGPNEEDVTPTIGTGKGAAFSYHGMAGSRQDSDTIKILGSLGRLSHARVLSSTTAGDDWTEKAVLKLLMPGTGQTGFILHPADDNRMYLLNFGNVGTPTGMIQYSENGGEDWQDKIGDWADDWDLLTQYQGSIEVFFP